MTPKRPLTRGALFCILAIPKPTRHNRSLCPRPRAGENVGLFCSCHQCTRWGAVTYWRNNVRDTVRSRRPRWAGERCSAFLFPNPNPTRCLMSVSIILSRPVASCGGRAPLSWLFKKLAHAGECRAIVELCERFSSLDAPVRFFVHGAMLTVGADPTPRLQRQAGSAAGSHFYSVEAMA